MFPGRRAATTAFIFTASLATAGVPASPDFAPQQTAPAIKHQHQAAAQKEAELKKRGAIAMGFDQDATAHQFLLAEDGGTIEVSVNDPADTANLDAIRSHLKEIAASFKQGDFSKPFQTHAEVPPGVEQMKAHKDAITYTYEETDRGGRVRIRTSNPEALEAIHTFLNYQISEHHTVHK